MFNIFVITPKPELIVFICVLKSLFSFEYHLFIDFFLNLARESPNFEKYNDNNKYENSFNTWDIHIEDCLGIIDYFL